ncbi:MAG: PBS lyase, partial [Proteobacteria bacterium]|nr:PBS lyase [Pseudomonadota bacterium]
TLAEKRPDIVRATPFYSLFPYITHPEAVTRGHAVRLLGRIAATEVESEIEKLTGDEAGLIIYEQGQPVRTTVAELAREALVRLHRLREPKK